MNEPEIKHAVYQKLIEVARNCGSLSPQQDVILEESLHRYGGRLRRPDIAIRNLRLLVEAEEDEHHAFHDPRHGVYQIREYANDVFAITDYDEIYCAVVWGDTNVGRESSIKTYLFLRTRDGREEVLLDRRPLNEFAERVSALWDVFKEGRIPLTPQAFIALFSPLEGYIEELRALLEKYKDQIGRLFSAYRNALTFVYGGVTFPDERLTDMYARHTILQAIALGVLNYVLGGCKAGVESIRSDLPLALPFLEWWNYGELRHDTEVRGDNGVFARLARDVQNQAIKVDWSAKKTDVFRFLYELLIPVEDRRQLGEYYTPLWLVNFTLDVLGRDVVREFVVLDPFCGSGTFLDASFRAKVEAGIPPQEAIRQVIGFDINPLAVVLARCELLTSYLEVADDTANIPIPLVYYLNSAEVFFSGPSFLEGPNQEEVRWTHLYEIPELFSCIASNRATPLPVERLDELEMALRDCLYYLDRGDQKMAQKTLAGTPLEEVVDFARLRAFVGTHGDSIWSSGLFSVIAKETLLSLKDLVVVSNPPWRSLDESAGDYQQLLSRIARTLDLHRWVRMNENRRVQRWITPALARGNIASIYLAGWMSRARKIAFVIPDSVGFEGQASYGVGKILTYKAFEIAGRHADVYRFTVDAFEHGIKPCVVVDGHDRAYEVLLAETPQRTDEWASYSLIDAGDYREHVDRVARYFFENPALLLGIDAIYVGTATPRFSGIYADDDDENPRAGLCVVAQRTVAGRKHIKLSGMRGWIDLSRHGLSSDVVKPMCYTANVYPFKLKPIQILWGESRSDTCDILRQIVAHGDLDVSDERKIENLIPLVARTGIEHPRATNVDKYYTVYREKRTFCTAVLVGHALMYQSCGYLECQDEAQAHYYCGVLNWLAFEAVRSRFLRNNHSRPLLALVDLQLEWKDELWQHRVADISKSLSSIAEEALGDEHFGQVRQAFRLLQGNQQFLTNWEELVNIVGQHVDEENLREVTIQLRESVGEDRTALGEQAG